MHPTVDTDKLATLARLTFSQGEAEKLREDLEAMIAFAKELSEANLQDLPPAEHVLPLRNRFRQDLPVPCQDRETLLAAAKTTADGYVTVPRILES